jgi:hypothetical protein
MRIQARATRRAGELLQQIEASQGGRPPKTPEGTHPSFSRKTAAREAGLSEHQQKQAMRLANIDEADFENALSQDAAPTVTQLSEQGKQARPAPADHLQGIEPEDFYAATHGFGALRTMAEACHRFDADQIG